MKTLSLIVLIVCLLIMIVAMWAKSTDVLICSACFAIITKLDLLESKIND